MDEIGIVDFHVFSAEERGHQLVDHEGVLGGDEFGIPVEKGVAEQLDDLVGAVSEDDVGNVEPKLFGDGGAELVAAAVRINVGLLDCRPHGFLGKRRGAERVLVGRDFDDGFRI